MNRRATRHPSRQVVHLSAQDLGGLLKAVVDKGVPCRFPVNGASMYPIIREGDTVTVEPLGRRAARPGDIVALTQPSTGRLLLHRVLAQGPAAVRTKGDNARRNDGWIPTDRVLGRVTTIEREGRPCRFGLGPERYAILALARHRPLAVALAPFRPLVRLARRLTRKDTP